MPYEAIVTTIELHEHPNADRLAIGRVAGHQVIVSKTQTEDELGIFFPSDGALSHEMCYENDLYRKNKGDNKTPDASGYLDSNRRIRNIRLRKVESDGLWLPLSSLAWTGADLSKLNSGDTLTHLNGKLICEKYYTKATRKALKLQQVAKAKKQTFVKTNMFAQHFSTKKLRYSVYNIPQYAKIIFTEKLHGTSGRTGHVKYDVIPPLNKLQEWIHWGLESLRSALTGTPYRDSSYSLYRYVTGSRRVDFDKDILRWTYDNSDYRKLWHEEIKIAGLHKGETLYYEIVGFQTDLDNPKNSTPIMHSHHIESKSLQKLYGRQMHYKYGCVDNQSKIFIYRITMTNEDGISREYTWDEIVNRCKELNLNHVPVLDTIIYEGITPEELLDLSRTLSEGSSSLDQCHIKEGVCLKIESPTLNTIYKYKSWNFCDLEGIRKNDENYVDIEEIS